VIITDQPRRARSPWLVLVSLVVVIPLGLSIGRYLGTVQRHDREHRLVADVTAALTPQERAAFDDTVHIYWPAWAQKTCQLAQSAKDAGYPLTGADVTVDSYVRNSTAKALFRMATPVPPALMPELLDSFDKVRPIAYRDYCPSLGLS
jgi:hypothetical protein